MALPTVAIIGRPNVGKSSLLNALLRADRAIVTPIPGTTRDTLEETLNLDGLPLVLVDTAGIRSDAQDMVEGLGIERSRAALAQADLALLVVDANEPLTDQDREIAALIGAKPAIIVINKTDLPVIADADNLLSHAPQVEISALTGAGIDQLEQAIQTVIFGAHVVSSDTPLVSSPRHRDIIRRAHDHILHAIESHQAHFPLDLLSIDLGAAVNALGEITGETASDQLLDTIFSRFCIGK